ncbi:MAG: hypothetical protein HY001_00215 [Candidatus Portnoybacteria bacterium]|nr:hypothetical protein [Candidatus Portnoybacteria bacterium]
MNPFTTIKKRDGSIVPFDARRITIAVSKAMIAANEGEGKDAEFISKKVLDALLKVRAKKRDFTPSVEQVQDMVEEQLILEDFVKTAKAYILYRRKRAELREQGIQVPEYLRKLAFESKRSFRNALAEFVYYRTYSRWIEEEGRRETWMESVARYVDFMKENLGDTLEDQEYEEIHSAIVRMEVMPSMRLLWSAGKAARTTNVAAYNCSYIAPTKLKDFGEIMYLLMCGTGVGFSVESQTVQRIPQIKRQIGEVLPPHQIEDSKEGWADALVLGLKTWFSGKDVAFDYSNIRPAGARLKTMGGKSSGPEPLKAVIEFCREKVLKRQGRRLLNIDVHDIICKIGEVVVMGGVRRCLPHYTLIHTKNGLKPIRDIHSGEEVLTGQGCYQKVIASQYTGCRRLLKINTQLGIFQSTPEHRWAALDDLNGNIRWVQAMDLTPDDTLLHIPSIIPGRNTTLPLYQYKKPKYSTITLDITIPALDEETAWLIGYFHGDGYVYRKSDTYGEVIFACSPDMPKTAQRVKVNLERFGVHPKITTYPYDNAIRIRAKSNQLANYLYKLKKPNASLTIPHFILQGTPEIRRAYVAGVFDADGSIKSRNGKKVRPIVASSIYPDWLRQLRAVLASLGVSSRMVQNRSARGNWKALWCLTTISIEALDVFSTIVAQRSEKLENDAIHLERKKEQCSFVVPRNLLALSPYRRWFDSAYYVPSSSIALSFSKFERTRQQYYPSGSSPIFPYRPIKVLGVSEGDVEDTYDIQVEGDERFVAEGMLVHNSALISLSDLDDPEMRDAKKGQFYLTEPQRSLANNSAVYNEKPSSTEFLDEWLSLAKSGSGERGIFNRGGLKKQLPKRRWQAFQPYAQTSGTNPCGEIILRSREFCNLTEIVARAEDTEDSLLKKTRIAAILGTYQSTLTNFPYLSPEWKKNCEEERLLGVSITGQWDSPAVRNPETLRKMKEMAVRTNEEYARRFNINPSACISCVKPSGTVSQLVDAASGMHPRHSKYYIRRIRISATDGLFKMLRDQGIPYYPEVGQTKDEATTYVLEFPVASPGTVFRDDLSALEQLEHWKMVKENFTEHNPSVTVSIGDDEWIGVANWLYGNWDILGGLSFLPRSRHVYRLAPYEEIGEEQHSELIKRFEGIDYSKIVTYEKVDETQGAKELACVAGVCEI